MDLNDGKAQQAEAGTCVVGTSALSEPERKTRRLGPIDGDLCTRAPSLDASPFVKDPRIATSARRKESAFLTKIRMFSLESTLSHIIATKLFEAGNLNFLLLSISNGGSESLLISAMDWIR